MATFEPAAPGPAFAPSGVQWYSTGSQSYGGAGQAYGAYDAGPSTSGAAAYGSFDDEPPLLEELGIDVPAIVSRTFSVLTFRTPGGRSEGLDIGGPILFLMLMGTAHLLVGKLHFGYILGWTVVGSLLLWFLLNSMVGGDPDASELTLYSCCCAVGYSMLPLVLHAFLSLLLPRRSPFALGAGLLAVAWSAQTAARLLVLRTPGLRPMHWVIAYPAALMFTAFALLTLY